MTMQPIGLCLLPELFLTASEGRWVMQRYPLPREWDDWRILDPWSLFVLRGHWKFVIAALVLVLGLVHLIRFIALYTRIRRDVRCGAVVTCPSSMPTFIRGALSGWIPAMILSSLALLLVTTDGRVFTDGVLDRERLYFAWAAVAGVAITIGAGVWWWVGRTARSSGFSRCAVCGYEAVCMDRCPECGGEYTAVGVFPCWSDWGTARVVNLPCRPAVAVSSAVFACVVCIAFLPQFGRGEAFIIGVAHGPTEADSPIESVLYITAPEVQNSHLWGVLGDEPTHIALNRRIVSLTNHNRVSGWMLFHQAHTNATNHILVPSTDVPIALRRSANGQIEYLDGDSWMAVTQDQVHELIVQSGSFQGFDMDPEVVSTLAHHIVHSLTKPERGAIHQRSLQMTSTIHRFTPSVLLYGIYAAIGILGGVGGWRGSRWLENRLERWSG